MSATDDAKGGGDSCRIGNILSAIKAGIITPGTKDAREPRNGTTLPCAANWPSLRRRCLAAALPKRVERYARIVDDVSSTRANAIAHGLDVNWEPGQIKHPWDGCLEASSRGAYEA